MNRSISAGTLVCVAVGAALVATGLLALARLERSARFIPSRDLSEAVADPEVTALPFRLAYRE